MRSAPLDFDSLHAALRAAGEGTRLRVLALLAEADLTVSDLTKILRQSQPRISRHLKLLAEAGLVDRFREGSWASIARRARRRRHIAQMLIAGSIPPIRSCCAIAAGLPQCAPRARLRRNRAAFRDRARDRVEEVQHLHDPTTSRSPSHRQFEMSPCARCNASARRLQRAATSASMSSDMSCRPRSMSADNRACCAPSGARSTARADRPVGSASVALSTPHRARGRRRIDPIGGIC